MEVDGPILKLYFDDMEAPVLEYADPDAWMYGGIGFRSNTTSVTFRNLSLHCTTCPVYGEVRVVDHTLWLTPDQTHYEIVLPFGVMHPPHLQAWTRGHGPETGVIVPDARIEVIQASSIPGEARILVFDREAACSMKPWSLSPRSRSPPSTSTCRAERSRGKVGGGSGGRRPSYRRSQRPR